MSLPSPASISTWSSSATRSLPCRSRCSGRVLAAWGPDGWHGRLQDWLGILLCMATARSAAMAFNRLVDRDYDALNPRTAGRHLPAGLLIGALGRALHRGLRAWPSSPRRCSSCPTAGRCSSRSRSCSGCWATPTPSGSPAWPISGWAPRSAWPRSRPGSRFAGDVAWPPVLLALAVLFWVTGFDIIYACQDVDFDREVGLQERPEPAGSSRRPRGSRPSATP